jgi:hypothetical protein
MQNSIKFCRSGFVKLSLSVADAGLLPGSVPVGVAPPPTAGAAAQPNDTKADLDLVLPLLQSHGFDAAHVCCWWGLAQTGGAGSPESVEVLLSVEDTGIGMDQAALDKLWDPFEQTKASIARDYGGTGLGLSIVRSIVDILGGTISVNSVLGRGTTFTVRLGFALPPASGAIVLSPAPQTASSKFGPSTPSLTAETVQSAADRSSSEASAAPRFSEVHRTATTATDASPKVGAEPVAVAATHSPQSAPPSAIAAPSPTAAATASATASATATATPTAASASAFASGAGSVATASAKSSSGASASATASGSSSAVPSPSPSPAGGGVAVASTSTELHATCSPPTGVRFQPSAQSSGPRVLVTDDSEVNRRILQRMLQDSFTVTLAHNGKEAVEAGTHVFLLCSVLWALC